MTELHQNVKSWLHERADWLQQAAELTLTKGALSEADISVLTDRLKTPEGQQVTNDRQFAELGASGNQTSEVRLKSIGEIVGIENLGPRTPLEFGKGNLCVIYGNNGSGKTGYTRLLKKAAGKPRAAELRHNIFQQQPQQRKAKIVYSCGDSDSATEWVANSAAIPELQAMDFFDTETATNYLSRENEAAYTPPLVSLFEKLAGTVNRVKDMLQVQQAALLKNLPQLPTVYAATQAGAQFNGLRANTNPTEVLKIKTWTEAEEQLLVQLIQRLATNDPAALARSKRATKIQIQQISTEIKAAAVAYSEEAVEAVRAKRDDARGKRKIAQEAAKIQSAKLDGIGGDTWKALWEAARSYSQTAYPQKDFPVVEDARCVLCQQQLAEDAKQRLQDFESFVRGNVEQAAVSAENAYKTALSRLPPVKEEKSVVQACQSAGLDDQTMLEGIRQFWINVAASYKGIQAGGDGIFVRLPQAIVDGLDALANDLEAQSKQHDQDAAGFDRVAAAQNQLELEAKKWTSQQAEAIDAEMQRLKSSAEFDKWLRFTNTQQITLKGSQVAESAITEAYVARFNQELGALKANRVKVKLVKTRAERGKAYHGLQLEGVDDGSAKLDQILSEGERRIVSLAAFMADVSEKPNASTFIFDDPISSLDQDFELAVASRLVKLARDRQVLVFTHRLSLVVAIEDAAGKMGDEWEKRHYVLKWIETFAGVSGQVALESARQERPKKANNILLDRLMDAKKKGEQDGSEAYKNLAAGLCSEIRVLLEKTVEHDLLSGIVLRNRTSVTTDNKLAGLANIKLEDCNFIDRLMTKYSTLVHSQSTENPIAVPEEPELREDLEALKTWREEFSKRPVVGVANG